jgi:hypothetical protein
MKRCNRADRALDAGEPRPEVAEDRVHPVFEEADEQVIFALEVVVDRAARHARLGRDLADARVVEAALGEDADRRRENALALVAGVGLADRSISGGVGAGADRR